MIWNGTDPLEPDRYLIPLQQETRHDRHSETDDHLATNT